MGPGARPAARDRRRRARPASGGERLLVAAAAAALPAYLALEGGGYDLVFRQQLGVAIWWGIALGLAFGFLPRARPAGAHRLAALALAGLIAWVALGMLGTESQGRTFEELGRLITYSGMLVLAGTAIGPHTWRDAAAGLAAGALAVCAVGLAGRLLPGAFDAVASPILLEGRRLAYPLGYWNAVAGWCAIAFCLGVSWSAHARRTLTRAIALGVLPVAGVALYLTYSRGGIVALVVGLVVVVAASNHRITAAAHAAVGLAATALAVVVVRTQPEIADGAGDAGGGWILLAVLIAGWASSQVPRLTRKARLDRRTVTVPGGAGAVAAAIAVVAVVAVAVGGASVAIRAGDEFAAGGRPDVDDDPAARLVAVEGTRSEIWGSALRAFGSEPASGVGAGSFQFWWQRDVAEGESLRDAHSLYLETLAELGLPGLLLLGLVLGGILAGALRARGAARGSGGSGVAAGLVGAYVAFLVHAGVDWVWEFPALIALGLGAGVVAGAARAKRRPRRTRLTAARLAAVVAAIAVGAVQIPAAVSASAARAGESRLALGRPDDAAELAGDAITAQPWSADAYALRAFVALSDGRPADALTDIADAIDLEPTNWQHRLLELRAHAELDNTGAALAASREGERLRPGLAAEFAAIRRQIRAGELELGDP